MPSDEYPRRSTGTWCGRLLPAAGECEHAVTTKRIDMDISSKRKVSRIWRGVNHGFQTEVFCFVCFATFEKRRATPSFYAAAVSAPAPARYSSQPPR
jgi:hypothetical protein